MDESVQKIYVIGHINPDTDSICSAIAYAELKNKLGKGGYYAARRAGQINSETAFVLKKFKVAAPQYLADVRTQVKDIEYRKVKGVDKGISIKRAWELMGERQIVTLPMVKDNVLEGLITIGDIAKSYMDIYDSEVLGKAKTPFANIVETLSGEMLCGPKDAHLEGGKVLIAAANPDLMENYIAKGDIVILGNRYESQLCAIEMEAACIVVCDGATVSKTIVKLAENSGCTIITTKYDTFTVARLINQSIPVRFFMKSENLITFRTDDYIEDIRQVMAKKFHRDFPVFHKDGTFAGMISRRNLLDSRRKKLNRSSQDRKH